MHTMMCRFKSNGQCAIGLFQRTAKQDKEENKRDASLETGLIGKDIVSKTKMINGWEKGKREREREREREKEREREQTEDENECGEFCSKGEVRFTLGYVHTYTFSKRSVFEKIRFGVSTHIVRQSVDPVHTDVDRSQETRLHLKITACVFYMYVDRDRLASGSNRTFFVCFRLLASVVLLYCFTCLFPMEGVYVVCESWRQVIKERLQRRNETQSKDEPK